MISLHQNQNHEPPCKRFTSTSFDDINFNVIQAHSKLRESGCSRQASLVYFIKQIERFLTKVGCKFDSTQQKVGPKQFSILQLKHNKYHCQGGWEYGISFNIFNYFSGQYTFDGKQSQENIVEQASQGKNEYEILEKLDKEQQKNIQYELSYHERYLKILNDKYVLPVPKQEKIDKLISMKKQVRKLHSILDIKIPTTQNSLNLITSDRKIQLQFDSQKNTQRSYPTLYNNNNLSDEVDSILQQQSSQRYGEIKQLDTKETDSSNIQSLYQQREQIHSQCIRRMLKLNSVIINDQKKQKTFTPKVQNANFRNTIFTRKHSQRPLFPTESPSEK